jgi:predicted RNA-binding Zn-ribbon protein involved in translation (DUF1610 family)
MAHWVTCSRCGEQVWMEDYERRACARCGAVIIGPYASSRTETYCGKCGGKVYVEDYESKACPNCGHVVRGPRT